VRVAIGKCYSRVDGAFRGLRELLIGGVSHESSQLNQDRLHGVVAAPVCEAGEFGRVNLNMH
jgi:hypothetical protein